LQKVTFAGITKKVAKRTAENMSLHTTEKKIRRDGADVTWRGSSFQARQRRAGKAWSPTMDNRVWTISEL